MADRILTYRAPGTGGMVTDAPEWELAPSQSPYMENQIMPRGISAEAGGYARTGPSIGQTMRGIYVAQLQNGTSRDVLITGDNYLGVLALDTSTLSSFSAPIMFGSTTYLPRALYDGEIISVDLNGTLPLMRYAGARGSRSAPTGTVSITADSPVVTGSGTNFTSYEFVNAYFWLMGYGHIFRVRAIPSNTLMSLDAGMPGTASGLSQAGWRAWGFFGLNTRVYSVGTASLNSGTGVVTGTGTNFLASGTAGQGVPDGNYDFFAPDAATSRDPHQIITTPTATSFQVNSSLDGTWPSLSNVKYVISRPLTAYDVAVHRNRVFAGGTSWDPNLLQILPPGAPLGRWWNEENSKDTDAARARIAAYDYVPAPTTRGRIVALISSPGPLLIPRTNNAYGFYGEYPDYTIDMLPDGDDAGCIDLRSACSGTPGQAWVGSSGIWWFDGTRCRDLTEGRRNREWRRLMDAINRSTAVVSAGFYGDYLRVDVSDGNVRTVKVKDYLPAIGTSQTWVYDFRAGAWCGLLTGTRSRYLHTSRLPGYDDELYAITDDGVNQLATFGSTLRDDGDNTTTGRQPMVIDLPANADAGTLSDLGRARQVKVTAEAAPAATLSLLSAATGATLQSSGTAALAPAAGQVVTTRFRPVTDATAPANADALGASGRTLRLRVTRTNASQPDAFRVHEVEVIARDRRVRA